MEAVFARRLFFIEVVQERSNDLIVFLQIVKNSFSLAQHFNGHGCLISKPIPVKWTVHVETHCFLI
jgi:hypothetical protein